MSITIPASMAKRVLDQPRRRSSYKKTKKHRSAKKTIPATIAASFLATLVLPASDKVGSPVAYAQAGNWEGTGKAMVLGWTGINANTGKFEGIPRYLFIMAAGGLAHKAASMLGINRQMAKLPAPFNKVSI